ncbi:DUF4339 domain-containing protein [Serratia fonticola]
MRWHYEKDGVRHGEIVDTEMLEKIRRGELNAHTLVWQPGMPDWQPLSSTPLAVALTQRTHPPVLPASRIPATVVWILAFAPLLGYLLEAFIAGMVHGDEMAAMDAVFGGQFWYITVLLNIALGYLDEMKLRKAGVDTTAFGKMAWLVPVYLWRRAKSLGQKPVYFWVWLVMFVLTLLTGV